MRNGREARAVAPARRGSSFPFLVLWADFTMPSNLSQNANGFPPTAAPARWNEVRSQEHIVSGTVSFLLHLLAILLLGFVFSISLDDEDTPRDLVMVIEEVEAELTESGDSLLPTTHLIRLKCCPSSEVQ